MKKPNESGFGAIEIVLVVIILALLGVVGWLALTRSRQSNGQAAVSNFEECAAAGHPVMESFPRQCRAGERTFVEQVETDEVVVDEEALGWEAVRSG